VECDSDGALDLFKDKRHRQPPLGGSKINRFERIAIQAPGFAGGCLTSHGGCLGFGAQNQRRGVEHSSANAADMTSPLTVAQKLAFIIFRFLLKV
jgi:hypothetical protein